MGTCTIINIEDKNGMPIGRFRVSKYLTLGDIEYHAGFSNLKSSLNNPNYYPDSGCEMITLRAKGTITSERAGMVIGDMTKEERERGEY